MTALAAPATLSPGPRALARLLLRLHRPALFLWVLLLLALSAVLLFVGGPLADDAALGWREYHACVPGKRCSYGQEAILLHRDVYAYVTSVTLAVPFLVAAWAGASLTGREIENGTAQLVWTQGLSPERWFAAKLALPAVAVAAGAGLLAALHTAAWSSGRGRIDNAKPWDDTATFYANGPAFVALCLAGLVAGALAGLAWRRTLPALVTAPAAAALVWLVADQAVSVLPVSHFWPVQLMTAALLLAVAAALACAGFRLIRHGTGALA
ncbi:hypothetical protein [Streptomyces sp. NPDC048172]|uniref:hypothetical protein n=1 Tax=Streptomyces sp. NPDC048172 TaxID=3365505 RepID=UPI003721AC66